MGIWDNLTSPDKWASGVANAFGVNSGDPSNPDRDALRGMGADASGFAGQGAAGFAAGGNDLNAQRDFLQGLARGQNSVSAVQLQQGLDQNTATQRSLAAGANPQNAAGAGRTAAMNAARLGYGMTGQQAVAGLQERNQAQMALAQLEIQRRQQDLGAALGGQQNAIGAYGDAMKNPQHTGGDLIMKGISGAGNAAGMAAMSDRRTKTAIKDGEGDASKAIAALKAFSFRYKDAKNGSGKQLGVMAQDLEKAGLKHAVIDTPAGKMVHGAKAATASLALVAELGRRVSQLEGGKAK